MKLSLSVCVCVSSSQVAVGQTDRVYFALEPPQLLKGDIMVRWHTVFPLVHVLQSKCECTACTFTHSDLNKSYDCSLLQIVCYNKNTEKGTRELVFRLQFHTGTLHGHPSLFHKKDLDLANKGTHTEEWHY